MRQPQDTDPMAYLTRYRRMLLDMHIPDWDDGFLAYHDPKELARCYELANVSAVMLYCKSHVGLAYWPTAVGKKHPAIDGDAVGDMVSLLHERDILVCGYTSVAYDRHAVKSNPDWSVVPAEVRDGEPVIGWPRYSVACLSKGGYLEYEKALLTELLETYPFDAFFLDMAHWPAICVCDDCRRRFAEEDDAEIPTHIDWESPHWTRFQAARERWADEFIQGLLAHARGLADIPVYHNFAVAFAGWLGGHPLRTFRNDSFLGADLTGGSDEQLFAMKLIRATSQHLPAEYMTPRAPTLLDHISVKHERQMTLQAFGAIALGSAVLFIDAIDPDGRVDPDVYEQVGRIYRHLEPYEAFAGGDHVEDVGVYFSSDAFIDLGKNGTPIDQSPGSDANDHLRSAIAATRALQQDHIAAGVVTYRQLNDLSRFKVLVVADLSRITSDEIEALRNYVVGGGHLYVSGRSSVLTTGGVRADDFLIADVLGVHFVEEERGSQLFLCPADEATAHAIAPQKYVGWTIEGHSDRSGNAGQNGPPRITADPGAVVLATRSLPYGYPEFGTHADQHWASVYSMPPWTHTADPMLVEHQQGAGRAIYSALPLERDQLPAGRALFSILVRRLLGPRATLSAECHPAIWLEAFHQRDAGRFVVNLLNYPSDFHPVPQEVTFSVVLPEDVSVVGVWRAPDRQPVPFEADGDAVRVTTQIDLFEALAIEYKDRHG